MTKRANKPKDTGKPEPKGAGKPAEAKKKYLKRAPRLLIRVTQGHIDTALPKDSEHCMIADAIKAAVPSARRVSVDLQTIRFSDPKRGLRYVYLTPRLPQEALIDFDEGKKVSPMQFRLAKAAQIISMQRGPSGKQKPVHDLGRKHLAFTETEKKQGNVPTVMGGRTPPVSRRGKRREFGIRGFRKRTDILIGGTA